MVDPPRAMVTAMAFSNASFTMIWRGRMPFSSRSTTASPERRASSSRRGSTAAGEALPGSDMPSASPTEAMVLAVNMPAQLPSVGQAWRSIRASSSSLRAPAALAPTASNTLTTSRARSSPGMWPGRMLPP